MIGLPNLLLKRFFISLLTLLLISIVIFFAVELRPGDYAEAFLMRWALPETVAQYREILGLDQPSYVRYFQWLGGVLVGDFGRSYANDQPVMALIWPRFKDTLFLASYAAVVAIPLSIFLGFVTVLYRNRFLDRAVNTVALVAVSLPEFFFATCGDPVRAKPPLTLLLRGQQLHYWSPKVSRNSRRLVVQPFSSV